MTTTVFVMTDVVGSVENEQGSQWFTAAVDQERLRRIGIKRAGGGAHQSKTMMLVDLSALMASGRAEHPAEAIVDDNLLGKPSIRAREAALYRLHQLYGVGTNSALWRVLCALWQRDIAGRPLLAVMTALARPNVARWIGSGSGCVAGREGQMARYRSLV